MLAACDLSVPSSSCPELDCSDCPAREVSPADSADCPQPVLYEDVWASSGHADKEAESFTHWDEADPAEIPVECAKCHSTPGYLDFLGEDGTVAGVVDNPVGLGTTITCFACHNQVTADMDRVVFPSGVEVTHLGPESRCIQCHQGRASTVAINEAIEEAGLLDDESSEELGFINSHSISGATPFGAEVQGAYEYDGKTYHGRYVRGDDFFGCHECHDNHTLEVKVEICTECHTMATDDPREIRVDTTDYDGDGDMDEGIVEEIESMHGVLLEVVQAYAANRIGTPIAFDPHVYPYFFADTNDDGAADPEEAVFENAYNVWTPRLLRAAYNLNYVSHDPGAYAHNSTYVLQALYDSLADIGGDVAGMVRP